MDVAEVNTPFLFVALMTRLCMMQTIIPAEVVKWSFLQHFKGGCELYRPVLQLFHLAWLSLIQINITTAIMSVTSRRSEKVTPPAATAKANKPFRGGHPNVNIVITSLRKHFLSHDPL